MCHCAVSSTCSCLPAARGIGPAFVGLGQSLPVAGKASARGGG
ncbi:hypothetical protein MBELCI_0160 [Limimaricola cinnabarinus LL-001]|uniref:Uncharacterized protein n=1 Tax=Limimaricola cinnabarinus LL-001 TaxID=1337093 RepID=U3AH36_9RHOB|nr:hypothetical protein MBELCI_0160 [Limimaricola cinnabarinus LL-001]